MAIGVSLDRDQKKQVDYILLFPKPGFTGPEVVRTEELGKGTILRVVGVSRARFLIFSEVRYVVELIGNKSFDAPIHIRITGSVDDSNCGLDQALYEKIQ